MHITTFALPLIFHRISSTEMVDISGIDRPLLFRELYKHASSKRVSSLNSRKKKIDAKAASMYVGKPVNDVNGVTMNVCIPSENHEAMLDTEKYNKVYGIGTAEKAIDKAWCKTLKLRKKTSRQSSGCSSKWRCDRCGCLLACISASVGIVVCGVASGLCCSFADPGATADVFNSFSNGNIDLPNNNTVLTTEKPDDEHINILDDTIHNSGTLTMGSAVLETDTSYHDSNKGIPIIHNPNTTPTSHVQNEMQSGIL